MSKTILKNINKPIFIIGSGRSGTTILYNLLSMHPDLAFFSNLTDKYYKIPNLSILHQAYNIPIIGDYFKNRLITKNKNKFIISPSEGENIYSCCGFIDDKKTTETDLQNVDGDKFKKIILSHLIFSNKKRFLGKRTANTQRLRLIHALFPDAYYIHIIRDGKAVIASLLKEEWWNNLNLWWCGNRVSDLVKLGRDPVEIAAKHWQRNVEEIFKNKSLLGKRYLEVRYEALVKNPSNVLLNILKFCQLKNNKSNFKNIPARLENMNAKWKERLTQKQKTILKKEAGKFLNNIGYEW